MRNYYTNIKCGSKERQVFVAKVKRFARSKAGLKKIKRLAPDIARLIENNPEYLDIPQVFNDPFLSGCYTIHICGRCVYVGESGNMAFRIIEHIYNYCTGADKFGHQYDPGIPAEFKGVAWGVTDKDFREAFESSAIDLLHPLLQYTSTDAPEYGSDKPIPDGETRETMRSDICITTNLKIERVNALIKAYEREKCA